MIGKQLGSSYNSRSAAQEHSGTRTGVFVGLAVIFLGMLVITLYVTGVYQQGIRPRLEPYVMKVRRAWEERQERSAKAQVDPSKIVSSRSVAPVTPESQAPVAVEQAVGPEADSPADPRQLIRVYERMRPKDAASIFEQLDVPLAVEILSQMPDRQAARILAAMAPDRAARLTSRLAERTL